MLGLLAWAWMRQDGDTVRRRDLIDPKRSIEQGARSRGYDDAAARRIADRGGDDRYEMPGTPRSAPAPVAAPDGGFAHLPDDLREQVWRAIHTGQVIHAVKLVRERTGLGLKESKDLVDAMRQDDVTLR